MESTAKLLSEIVYTLLEVDYRISKPATRLIPLTTLLTTFVHKHPHARLSQLILSDVVNGYFGIPLPIFSEGYLGNKVQRLALLAAGSSVELGLFAFPCGDVDIMLFFRNLNATSSPTLPSPETEILRFDPDLQFPGFAYLFKENGEIFSHADLEKRMTVSDPVLTKLKRHGPAWIMPNLLDGTYTYDFVPAVVCETWPPEAESWKKRKRPSGWPSEAMIKDIVQDGCFVVPVSHRNSANQGKQWRLSFSRAEVLLVQSLDISQKIVYHILKNILQSFPAFNGNPPLSSYHLKTLLLWSCEKTPSHLWTKHNIVYNCRRLLKDARNCIFSGKWPHYFIPENNISPKFCCDSLFCAGCKFRDVPKGVIAAHLNSLLHYDSLCTFILEWCKSFAIWYWDCPFPGSLGPEHQISLSLSLDFIKSKVGNYEQYQRRNYANEMAVSAIGLVFFALNSIAKSDNNCLLGLADVLPSLLSKHGEQAVIGIKLQFLGFPLSFYYYMCFIQSSTNAAARNWKFHEAARKAIVNTLEPYDHNEDVLWFPSTAVWCYLEYAQNPRADISELVNHCDYAIQLFKSSRISSKHERFCLGLFGLRPIVSRRLFCILDDVSVSVVGFLVLCEWLYNYLFGKNSLRLCFDLEECRSVYVVYFVKLHCLLRIYNGTPWERSEILSFVREFEELTYSYGRPIAKILYRVSNRIVQNLDRKSSVKTRVY